jgi:4-aminobutyrate aminotransferase-like enzyme
MTSHNIDMTDVCTRVKQLGYSASQRVKLYGEEYEVVSDPFVEGEGIAVRAKSKRNPSVRTVQLPSTILQGVLKRRLTLAA